MTHTLLAQSLNFRDQAVTQAVPYANQSFGSALGSIVTAIMAIAVLAVFIFLVIAAFDYVLAGGDKGKLESARNKITQSIIGIIVLASVFVIMQIVQAFLHINLINFGGGSSSSSNGNTNTTQICPQSDLLAMKAVCGKAPVICVSGIATCSGPAGTSSPSVGGNNGTGNSGSGNTGSGNTGTGGSTFASWLTYDKPCSAFTVTDYSDANHYCSSLPGGKYTRASTCQTNAQQVSIVYCQP